MILTVAAVCCILYPAYVTADLHVCKAIGDPHITSFHNEQSTVNSAGVVNLLEDDQGKAIVSITVVAESATTTKINDVTVNLPESQKSTIDGVGDTYTGKFITVKVAPSNNVYITLDSAYPGTLSGACGEISKECFIGDSKDYSGSLSVTESGRTCQPWNANSPHKHGWKAYSNPNNFPSGTISHNNCRNPGGEGDGSGATGKKPWCYTTDSSKRWEYCDVDKCVVPEPFENKGCWGNKVPQQMTRLEGSHSSLTGNYKKRKDAVQKCFDVATAAGYDYSAVGNGGQCWAGYGDSYQVYGPRSTCPEDGTGKYAIVQVYFIKGSPAATCYKNEYGIRGNIRDVPNVTSPSQCQKLCQKEPGCNAWVYRKPTHKQWANTCGLKKATVDKALKTNTGVVAGPKNC